IVAYKQAQARNEGNAQGWQMFAQGGGKKNPHASSRFENEEPFSLEIAESQSENQLYVFSIKLNFGHLQYAHDILSERFKQQYPTPQSLKAFVRDNPALLHVRLAKTDKQKNNSKTQVHIIAISDRPKPNVMYSFVMVFENEAWKVDQVCLLGKSPG
ncbi:MAG: hypothetical protein U0798_21030, partial [Gemmataceae bacterium]